MRITILFALVLSLFAGSALADCGDTAALLTSTVACAGASSSSADALLFAVGGSTSRPDPDWIPCTDCGSGWYCYDPVTLVYINDQPSGCTFSSFKRCALFCGGGCAGAYCWPF